MLEVPGDLGHRHDEKVPERVPVQAALLEAVLEEGGHERLDVGQCCDALAEVARRQDPVLGTEPAGAAPVVGHGDDRGQVSGVLLESPQQGGEPGAPAQRHHPRALLEKPVVVNDLGQGPVPPRQEGAEDGLGQLVERIQDDAQTEGSKQPAPDVPVQELQGQVVENVGKLDAGPVDVGQGIADPEADEDHPDHEEDEPTFDVEAGGEPAHHPGVHT